MFLPHPGSPANHELSEIYIDESSQTKHDYLVLGGVIIPASSRGEACDEVWRQREPELPHGELKWGKVSKGKLFAYKRVVDAFFDRSPFHAAHFHSIVVDTQKLNHKAFNEGSSEVGFNKEIYQLASKFARLYPRKLFHLYPDYRSTDQRPDDLRNILNFGRRKAGDRRDWPFRRCHFRDSKNTPMLWFSDIFAGAIAYHVNGHILKEGASPAKCDLARHILVRAGIRNPMIDTSIGGKFTIWHRQLR